LKAVILAGGLGTRLTEETQNCPKPMVEIGGRPILWHIMKIYSAYGINEFIICCGYKGFLIKEYFSEYFLWESDVTIDLVTNRIEIHAKRSEPWSVTLLDTGESTMTGGRLKRVAEFIKDEPYFCFTYGDGLSDLNVRALIDFHIHHGKEATLTSVYPRGRFGALDIENDTVMSFVEKPRGDGSMVNGGFFVLSPSVLDRIRGDDCVWEEEPLASLAQEGQLKAFRHSGFWQPMDTLRDKIILNELWDRNAAPWKVWDA